MTHNELISSGIKWLKDFGCSVILKEKKSITAEIPDLLARKSEISILLEAKASISDFRADKKKAYRIIPKKGVGNYRLFIAEKGLIPIEELLEGWGLLEVDSFSEEIIRTRCWKGNIAMECEGILKFQPNLEAEKLMLLSMIRSKK